jgi:hypothetical protein
MVETKIFAALRDLIPQHGRAFAQAQPPCQHRVLVHALRQRRRLYPLSLAHARQRLRDHLHWLLQSI